MSETRIETREIFIHKAALGRLSEMVRSDIFRGAVPIVHAKEAKEQNDGVMRVQCEGTKGILDRLEFYARGLSDALHHCVTFDTVGMILKGNNQ